MSSNRFPKITEQGLADLRKRIGVKITDSLEPWNHEATRDAIRHYAHGIGDDNPLWTDPEYAAKTKYGTLVALPSFLFSTDRIISGYCGGLSGIHAFAATNREPGLFDQIIQSLTPYQAKVQAILDRKLKEGQSIAYYEIYEPLTGKKAPNNDTYLDMPSSRPRMFIFKGDATDPEAAKAALTAELKAVGISNPDLAISGIGANHVLMLKTYITRDSQTVEKRFSEDPVFKITQDFWLTPELEVQLDAMRKPQ